MPLKLTLDIFSGRPNPEMLLDDTSARKLFKQLSFNKLSRISKSTAPFPSVLGYRGLIIEQTGKLLTKDLPSRIHYAHDTIYAGEMAAKTETGLESFLFDNLKVIKGIKGLPGFRDFTQKRISDYLDKRKLYIDNYNKWIPEILDDFVLPSRVICPCAPSADLTAWNTDPNVQSRNNCYNYSTNYRSDTYGQPGQAAGQKWTKLTGCDVPAGEISAKMGAIADGLVDKPSQDNKCISPGHLVALVIDPGTDYHWFRKGSNGKWSHKPGGTPATILDNSGNPITDPRTADRGGYTDFCTFMQVRHGHFKVEGLFD